MLDGKDSTTKGRQNGHHPTNFSGEYKDYGGYCFSNPITVINRDSDIIKYYGEIDTSNTNLKSANIACSVDITESLATKLRLP